MPLFFNNDVCKSQDMGWWGALMEGWVSERKRDFLILGVGSVIGRSGIKDQFTYGCAVQQAIDRAFAVTTRNIINHPKLIQSICPAAFAITEPRVASVKICNFMTDGAHDPYFDDQEAEIWRSKIQELSDYCLNNDFYFIEHSRPDYEKRQEHGRELGWPEDRIICYDTAEEYVDTYSRAECYVGNRLHGAVLVASLGRPAIGIGYESRLEMVERVGGHIYYPSTFELKFIESLEVRNNQVYMNAIEDYKQEILRILKSFINQ